MALAIIAPPIDSVILLLLHVRIIGDTLIDGPASVTYLPNISLVQVHHTRELVITFGITDLAVVHAGNFCKFLLDVMPKGNLELGYDPNNWMALVFELLPDLKVDLSDHAREVVQCFLFICFFSKAPSPLTIDKGTEVLREVERVLQ